MGELLCFHHIMTLNTNGIIAVTTLRTLCQIGVRLHYEQCPYNTHGLGWQVVPMNRDACGGGLPLEIRAPV